ncbi:uncharacterized protein [Palaemon carinicauda]|uniref:uncharacterized protein n=1 Tax=Palaemon carinicauda TaxID=392227 RepID=UPI0035B65884
MVHCQTTACAAVLHQPCGHTVCRSHALCGVQLEDIVVWHPDNCMVCFDLITTLGSDSASPEQKTAARATLKVWVGGFARNVKSKQPYVLSEDYCAMIYPNAKSSAAVARAVAAPIIADIDATISGFIDQDQDQDTSDAPRDLEDNVASLNSDVEPMLLDDPDAAFSRFKVWPVLEFHECSAANLTFNYHINSYLPTTCLKLDLAAGTEVNNHTIQTLNRLHALNRVQYCTVIVDSGLAPQS